MKLKTIVELGGLAVAFFCFVGGLQAQSPLRSPWDLHSVKVTGQSYDCSSVGALPHDIVASDYYSDSKHSIIDSKRQRAYNEAKAQYAQVTLSAEKAADDFQKSGSIEAAACVMKILTTQAKANAMTGTMSSNQAQYVQNWTVGALAITYLKVRSAGLARSHATVKNNEAVQLWMKTVGQQVEAYFQKRHEKKTKDGTNNHLYWAGFAVMSVGIAANDRSLYDWGVGTYKYGVDCITPDGTLPLEMDRGQRALHYHLFALAPLVTMAELGEVNGQDLYAYDHDALHRLVSRSFAGLRDNHFFAAKAGVAQDTPEDGKIKPNDVDWVLPYVNRFPDPAIRSLLQQTGIKPYVYLGGLPPS